MITWGHTAAGVLSVLIGATLFCPRARANPVLPVNLGELCARADRIFRGTVVSATPGMVRVAGMDVPTTTYRIRVVETFKGESADSGHVELRMLSGGTAPRAGARRVVMVMANLPRMDVGGSYLLFATRASSIGMASTVGFAQGVFRVSGDGEGATAVNGHGNQLLFRGMDATEHPRAGPIAYRELAGRIRGLVRAGGQR